MIISTGFALLSIEQDFREKNCRFCETFTGNI